MGTRSSATGTVQTSSAWSIRGKDLRRWECRQPFFSTLLGSILRVPARAVVLVSGAGHTLGRQAAGPKFNHTMSSFCGTRQPGAAWGVVLGQRSSPRGWWKVHPLTGGLDALHSSLAARRSGGVCLQRTPSERPSSTTVGNRGMSIPSPIPLPPPVRLPSPRRPRVVNAVPHKQATGIARHDKMPSSLSTRQASSLSYKQVFQVL